MAAGLNRLLEPRSEGCLRERAGMCALATLALAVVQAAYRSEPEQGIPVLTRGPYHVRIHNLYTPNAGTKIK